MRIMIKMHDAELTEALREHVEHRLALALSQSHVRGAVVRLSIDGPKDGINKRCQLRIRLTGRPDLVVEETEADFQVAVNRAADRARRTLARSLLHPQHQSKPGLVR